jgi:hypothetical protein
VSEASRRDVLRTLLLAGAATAAVGLAIIPETADAVVVVAGPHRRRHRRWRCWWHRGRRVCGWRW